MTLKFLFLPLVLVSVFFAGVFWGKPLWQENQALKKKVAEYTKELNEIKDRAGFAQKAIEQYSALGGDRVLIENALPKEKVGNILLAEFFEKAKKSGVFLKNIKIGEEEDLDLDFLQIKMVAGDGEGVASSVEEKKLTVDQILGVEEKEATSYGLKMTRGYMELVGSYEEIRNFILELEKMNRLVNVLSINLKRIEVKENSETGKEGSSPGVKNLVQIDLEIGAYWLKSRVEEVEEGRGKQIAPKTFFGDPILKDLLSGKFSVDALTNFQNSITKDVFQFSGKEDSSGPDRTSLF